MPRLSAGSSPVLFTVVLPVEAKMLSSVAKSTVRIKYQRSDRKAPGDWPGVGEDVEENDEDGDADADIAEGTALVVGRDLEDRAEVVIGMYTVETGNAGEELFDDALDPNTPPTMAPVAATSSRATAARNHGIDNPQSPLRLL